MIHINFVLEIAYWNVYLMIIHVSILLCNKKRTWDWEIKDWSLMSSGMVETGSLEGDPDSSQSGSLRLGFGGRLGRMESKWDRTCSEIWSCWSGSMISSLRLGLMVSVGWPTMVTMLTRWQLGVTSGGVKVGIMVGNIGGNIGETMGLFYEWNPASIPHF